MGPGGLLTRGVDIGRPALQREPFAHALIERCVDARSESALLNWLETEAPWRLVETDFYAQYEFSLLNETLPASLAPLFGPDALDTLRRRMAETFEVSMASRLNVVAHRLESGQRIAIHNDFLKGGETHRLTVQLNRGLTREDGGLFLLFNSFDPADIHSIHAPVSASGIVFAIGPDSHHAVSQMHGGERFTLVYSFHADTG